MTAHPGPGRWPAVPPLAGVPAARRRSADPAATTAPAAPPVADLSRRAWLAAAMLPIAAAAEGSPPAPAEVVAALPGARAIGHGTLRLFGLRIYDAWLWSPGRPTATDWARTPLALELRYARTLRGPLIAERSVGEMRRQRELSADEARRWRAALEAVLVDVHNGDRCTGVHAPGQGASFFLNSRSLGGIADGEFATLFFGIWLAPQTSEPGLRQALLSGSSG